MADPSDLALKPTASRIPACDPLPRTPAGGGEPSFVATRHAGFPPLGWLCELTGPAQVEAAVGKDVDLFERGLVEGCWDGPFEAGGYRGSPTLFGSGVCWAEGDFWFCPPAHTNECLYALVHHGRRFVSNSLYLLFRECGAPLDVRQNYTRALASLAAGINDADEVIYRSDETVLYRILYDDFTFASGSPARQRKQATDADVSDFAHYRDHLLRVIRGCMRNANAAGRRRRNLISTASSGYDSNTAAALAREASAVLAITLSRARWGGDDSGRAAAEAMGLACVERNPADPRTDRNGRVIEFLMSGAGGADYPISVFAPELAGTVCATGHHGDSMWDPAARATTVLRRMGNSGASMAEFRLRVSFFHIPVPFIAALRQPEVVAISKAAEMRPWSTSGRYDRPICRRVVEEAGAPRATFGQSKRAMAVIISWGPMFLSPELRRQFTDFLRREGLLGSTYVGHGLHHLGHLGYRVINKAVQRAKPISGLLRPVRDGLYRRFGSYENSPFANLLFVWAMREAIARPELVAARDQPLPAAPSG